MVTARWANAVLSIPSPSTNIWHIGAFPLRAYALCIIAGIIVAVIIATRRWRARGGTADSMEMMVVVGVPFGIVGARLYHVITDYQLYFGPGRHPLNALKIWEGGLGVWGAIAFGLLGGYLVARRRRIAFPAVLDAIAPAILVAQAIGRLGNWFNQELFGRPTTLPWALEIAPQYRPPGYEQFATFHPTFLYEMLWNLAAAVLLVWLDRRFRLGHGKVFALYVLLYTAGLKRQDGGDIILWGGPTVAAAAIEADLVDELHLVTHPIIAGRGKKLFANVAGAHRVRHLSTSTFPSGVVVVKYARA